MAAAKIAAWASAWLSRSVSGEFVTTAAAAGSPELTAAAGAAVVRAPDRSRRLTASVAQANGAARGASGSLPPPSHANGFRPASDSAPRAAAVVITGAAGVDVDVAAAGAICWAASTVSDAAGAVSAAAETWLTTAESVDARGAEVTGPLMAGAGVAV